MSYEDKDTIVANLEDGWKIDEVVILEGTAYLVLEINAADQMATLERLGTFTW